MGPDSKHVPMIFFFPIMNLNNFKGQNEHTLKCILACSQLLEYFRNSKNQRLFVSKTSLFFNTFHAFIVYFPELD